MLYSNRPRAHYRKHQLAEVICQLRFPEILSIETTLPADFQEAIRDFFPIYTLRKEPVIQKIGNSAPAEGNKTTNNYQFTTLDSFIVDNDWLNIEAMKDSSQLNANTVKML